MISCHKHLIRFLPALLLAGAGLVAAQPPAAVVELANVSEGQSSSVARLAGTVISTRDAQVAAELEGRLTWLARVGDKVRAGDPLASIDDYLLQLRERDDRSEIARLDADIDYHQRQIERLRSLEKTNNMARAELDQIESQLEMLRQQRSMAAVALERTRYNIARSQVLAPFDGVVAARSASEGEYARAGQALVRLVDTVNLEISVNAPLRVARFNRAGDPVEVTAGEETGQALIRGLVPVGDARSRMLELRLTPEDQRWLIGEAVTVALPDSLPEATLQVPRDALVLRDNEVFVYTVGEDDTARKVTVTTGAGRDSLIGVVGDLRAGDPVVVRGAERLREGQALKVVRHHIAATP